MPLSRFGPFLLWAVACSTAFAQEQTPPEPPEEDQILAVKEYSFNPVQANKELKTGEFYFRKGSYRAAAGRFREATRWNPSFSLAYLRLGDAYERLKDPDSAQKAYQKYLELEPKGKEAAAIRKKLATKR